MKQVEEWLILNLKYYFQDYFITHSISVDENLSDLDQFIYYL